MESAFGDTSIAEAGGEERPPSVLQVLPALVTGGVERGTVDMAAALVDAGWRSFVCSAGGPMVREIERAGAEHITLPLDSKNPFVMRANTKRLCEIIEAHGIDIVHARSRAPAWSARAAAERTGAAFVTTFHGTYNSQSFLKRRYNGIMTKGERVIAISDFIARHMQSTYRVDPSIIRVIHRGVDTSIFNPLAVSQERMIALAKEWRLADGVPVIMLPGRLTRWKGQEVLIDALAKLGRDDIRCVLVGGDQGRESYRRELERRIARHGVEHIVQLVGDCRDMPTAYILSNIVVSASTDPEAFGRVAAEAQALGKPVIATDHGGARETVDDGQTGWLVPPGDVDALAAALDLALNMTEEERDAMSRRAMSRVRENFSRKQMCAQTLEVYSEVLAAHGRAAP